MERSIHTPLTAEMAKELKAGDYVYLTGTIYVARDAAHKRMAEALQAGQELPFPVKDAIIYYMGPSPARPGKVIGSAGPTTATRMDKYTPALLDLGLRGMIGKGRRNQAVKDAIVRHHAIYFVAVGGAGALYAECVKRVAGVSLLNEFGAAEAVWHFDVEGFRGVVAMDAHGRSLFDAVRRKVGI